MRSIMRTRATLSIVLFAAFAAGIFMFIRFFASYPSNTGVIEYSPEKAAERAREMPLPRAGGLESQESKEVLLSTFSHPDIPLVFDYPREWHRLEFDAASSAEASGSTALEPEAKRWTIADAESAASASVVLEISTGMKLPACASNSTDCVDLVVNNRPFRKDRSTLSSGATVIVYSTLHEKTAYVFKARINSLTPETEARLNAVIRSVTFL